MRGRNVEGHGEDGKRKVVIRDEATVEKKGAGGRVDAPVVGITRTQVSGETIYFDKFILYVGNRN